MSNNNIKKFKSEFTTEQMLSMYKYGIISERFYDYKVVNGTVLYSIKGEYNFKLPDRIIIKEVK